MVTPLLYVWGDDDLLAERLVGRFGTALAAELGSPLDRWDARPDQQTATTVSAQLAERLTTRGPVRWRHAGRGGQPGRAGPPQRDP